MSAWERLALYVSFRYTIQGGGPLQLIDQSVKLTLCAIPWQVYKTRFMQLFLVAFLTATMFIKPRMGTDTLQVPCTLESLGRWEAIEYSLFLPTGPTGLGLRG